MIVGKLNNYDNYVTQHFSHAYFPGSSEKLEILGGITTMITLRVVNIIIFYAFLFS